MLAKTKWIQIDIGCLNNDICYIHENGDPMYGYKSLKHYYLNNKNEIEWNNIKLMFMSLHKLYYLHKKN